MRALLMAGAMAFGFVGAANAAIIGYSETFSSGQVVSGTFTATVNGNAITDISAVKLSFNGVAITRPIYVEHYNGSGFVDGGAFATFDNISNNFLFVDSNLASGDSNYDAFFYSITPYGDVAQSTISQGGQSEFTAVTFTNLSATAVPEPASMALLGLGAFGVVAARRRKAV